eukprot:ANDGO_04343.mRNA.1 Transmembrane protein 260 homolog
MKRRREQLAAEAALFSLVSVIAGIFYCSHCFRTVGPGDSGELVLTAHHWAVPHPPGYPLFVLVNWIWQKAFFFVDSVAFRMNLGNAVVQAWAAGFHALNVHRLSGTLSLLDAALLSLVTFTSCLFVSISGYAEVFSYHLLFSEAFIYCTIRVLQDSCRSVFLVCGAVLAGLSLANQHTSIFVLFSGVLMVAVTLRLSRTQFFVCSVVSAGVCCSVYGMLPIAEAWSFGSRHNPHSWGFTAHFESFVSHLLRRDYGTLTLFPGAVDTGETHPMRAYFSDSMSILYYYMVRDYSVAAYAAIALAIATCFSNVFFGSRRTSACVYFLALSQFMYITVFFSLSNLSTKAVQESDLRLYGVFSRFLVLPIAITFLLAVPSTDNITRTCGLRTRNMLTFTLACFLILAVFGGSFIGIPSPVSNTENAIFQEFAHATLGSLPPRAILFTKGDLATNALRYSRFVEGVRPDILLSDMELLTQPWMVLGLRELYGQDLLLPGTSYGKDRSLQFLMREIAQANPGRRIFFVPHIKDGDHSLSTSYSIVPNGFAVEVLRKHSPAANSMWQSRLRNPREFFDTFFVSKSVLVPFDFLSRHSRRGRYPEDGWENPLVSVVANLMMESYLMHFDPQPPTGQHNSCTRDAVHVSGALRLFNNLRSDLCAVGSPFCGLYWKNLCRFYQISNLDQDLEHCIRGTLQSKIWNPQQEDFRTILAMKQISRETIFV